MACRNDRKCWRSNPDEGRLQPVAAGYEEGRTLMMELLNHAVGHEAPLAPKHHNFSGEDRRRTLAVNFEDIARPERGQHAGAGHRQLRCAEGAQDFYGEVKFQLTASIQHYVHPAKQAAKTSCCARTVTGCSVPNHIPSRCPAKSIRWKVLSCSTSLKAWTGQAVRHNFIPKPRQRCSRKCGNTSPCCWEFTDVEAARTVSCLTPRPSEAAPFEALRPRSNPMWFVQSSRTTSGLRPNRRLPESVRARETSHGSCGSLRIVRAPISQFTFVFVRYLRSLQRLLPCPQCRNACGRDTCR